MGNKRLPDYAKLREPSLLFNPVNEQEVDRHPLRGLSSYGPYSSTFAPALVQNPIRIGLITIEGYGRRISDYLNALRNAHEPKARSKYFPGFPGFQDVYRVDIQIPQKRQDPVALIPEHAARESLAGEEPERKFLELIAEAIRAMNTRRSEFDILVFYFPNWLEPIFRVWGADYEFNLRYATKAITAGLGIPSQVILDRSIEYPDRSSVLWSLSVALYAKSGGIPWKLHNSIPGTAYVGLSYVLTRKEGRRSVLTCCSQVFDSQGHGLQFLLFTADDFTQIGKNPFLKRTDMRRLLSKTLEVYVRQTGRLPQRLVAHKTSHFTADERAGASEALNDLQSYELLQIQEESPWGAVKGQRGYATPFPVDRGTVLPVSRYSYLLWTQGDAWGIAESNRSFYQEAKGIPSPLIVTQHAGATQLLDSAAEIMALTRMNWNTGRLYNSLPVTIKSASALGQIAKYMTTYTRNPYPFRLFM